MTLIYRYYPEESKVINEEIYLILHHHTYTSLFCVILGGLFLYFYIPNNIFYYDTFSSAFSKYTEEPESINKFDKIYMKTKKKVPAILFRPKDLPKLIKIIVKKYIDISLKN